MHQSNRLKTVIERKILTPAYLVMLAGLVIRSMALVLSAAIPYGSWPLWVKIIIEAFAAFGMVGSADIVLSISAASAARKDHEIYAVLNSSEFQPNPRLSPQKYERQRTQLEQQRELVLGGLRSEKKKEMLAVYCCGAITVTYGILFAFTVLAEASFVAIMVEVVGVGAIPFITWYLSAQYKEEVASPEQRAQALALESVDGRLQAAQERFAHGVETESDLSLLETATDGSPYHRKLVKALRQPDPTVEYMTTAEIYRFFEVSDASGQAVIRRIVRNAGKARKHGVVQNPEGDGWLTPKGSLVYLFPQFIGRGGWEPSRRTRASRPRTQEASDQTADGQLFEHTASSTRTPGDGTKSDDGLMREAAPADIASADTAGGPPVADVELGDLSPDSAEATTVRGGVVPEAVAVAD